MWSPRWAPAAWAGPLVALSPIAGRPALVEDPCALRSRRLLQPAQTAEVPGRHSRGCLDLDPHEFASTTLDDHVDFGSIPVAEVEEGQGFVASAGRPPKFLKDECLEQSGEQWAIRREPSDVHSKHRAGKTGVPQARNGVQRADPSKIAHVPLNQ